MKRIFLLLLAAGCLLTMPACRINFTVVSSAGIDQVARPHHLSHQKTHWSYLWGLTNGKKEKNSDLFPAGCDPGSNISRMRVSTNPEFVLISVITLGIVVPQHLEWDCSQVKHPLIKPTHD